MSSAFRGDLGVPSATNRLSSALLATGPRRLALFAALVGGYGLTFASEASVRAAEARGSANLMRLLGVSDVTNIGASTLYPVDGIMAGHTVTVGCTAALLMVPFVLVGSILLLVERIPVTATFKALLAAALLTVACNQTRMLVIAFGMIHLGVERGYGVTHVLIGTTVSTIGMGVAAFTALRILLRSAASNGGTVDG